MNEVLDFVSVLTVDLREYSSWHNKHRHLGAPLFCVDDDVCIERAVSTWLGKGLCPQRLVVGEPRSLLLPLWRSFPHAKILSETFLVNWRRSCFLCFSIFCNNSRIILSSLIVYARNERNIYIYESEDVVKFNVFYMVSHCSSGKSSFEMIHGLMYNILMGYTRGYKGC